MVEFFLLDEVEGIFEIDFVELLDFEGLFFELGVIVFDLVVDLPDELVVVGMWENSFLGGFEDDGGGGGGGGGDDFDRGFIVEDDMVIETEE